MPTIVRIAWSTRRPRYREPIGQVSRGLATLPAGEAAYASSSSLAGPATPDEDHGDHADDDERADAEDERRRVATGRAAFGGRR